jgi:V-type H+-transporting ATPase subunit a
MFRSQLMKYYSLVVPRESAWDVVNVLGDLDCLHFEDHDPTLLASNRPFANYVKR